MAVQEACNDLQIADESPAPVSSSLGVEDGLQGWKSHETVCAVLIIVTCWAVDWI